MAPNTKGHKAPWEGPSFLERAAGGQGPSICSLSCALRGSRPVSGAGGQGGRRPEGKRRPFLGKPPLFFRGHRDLCLRV